MSMTREMARNYARSNMKDAGFAHINKKKYPSKSDEGKKRSYFSLRWREWVNVGVRANEN